MVRNGHTRAGSAVALCRGCGRLFCPTSKRPPITPEREALIRRLLLEWLSLRAIARSAGVSRAWLQRLANRLYGEETPHTPKRLKESGDLTVEADEPLSFVGHKRRVCWVWVALDVDTRQVVAMVAGDRSEDTARRLWAARPAGYRDRAVVCTDFWHAHLAAVPRSGTLPAGRRAG